MTHTILLVEDNPHIMKVNRGMLEKAGYRVLCAETVTGAQALLEKESPHLLVLDIMLPDGDGLALCRELKKTRSVPILFLSAMNTNEDIIAGLRAGGDDYLPKPYDLDVLVARVEARLRSSEALPRELHFGALKLDTLAMAGYLNGEDLLLTPKEFAVLLLLVENAERVVDKEEIFTVVWGQTLNDDNAALWMLISRLKKKLKPDQTGLNISTHRGKGYMLEHL